MPPFFFSESGGSANGKNSKGSARLSPITLGHGLSSSRPLPTPQLTPPLLAMRASTPTLRTATRLAHTRPARAATHAARAAPPRDGGLGSLLSEFKLNSQALLDVSMMWRGARGSEGGTRRGDCARRDDSEWVTRCLSTLPRGGWRAGGRGHAPGRLWRRVGTRRGRGRGVGGAWQGGGGGGTVDRPQGGSCPVALSLPSLPPLLPRCHHPRWTVDTRSAVPRRTIGGSATAKHAPSDAHAHPFTSPAPRLWLCRLRRPRRHHAGRGAGAGPADRGVHHGGGDGDGAGELRGELGGGKHLPRLCKPPAAPAAVFGAVSSPRLPSSTHPQVVNDLMANDA